MIGLENRKIFNNKRLTGSVVKGRQVGRTIGFPTANLMFDQQYIPNLKNGVYAVEVYYSENKYYGLMNIGIRPTFNEDKPSVSYEVHILNFHKEIYGETLQVKALFYIRDEQSFHSKDQLTQQLKRDVD